MDAINCAAPYAHPELVGLDLASAEESTPRWYGVAFGNGNDGVGRMWPSFYCRTADPWTLARAAVLSQFRPGAGWDWAAEAMDVDGDADYGISVAIYDPPPEDSDDSEESEDSDDCGSWCDSNGAWLICEVWPDFPDDNPQSSAPEYDGLEACFDPLILAQIAAGS